MTPQISTRLAVLILTASTVVSSYIMLFVGCVLPKFFATAFNTNSASDLDILIPPITRFALPQSSSAIGLAPDSFSWLPALSPLKDSSSGLRCFVPATLDLLAP